MRELRSKNYYCIIIIVIVIVIVIIIIIVKYIWNNSYLNCGLEHRTGIAGVMSSNPVEALIFSGFFFSIA